MHVIEIMPLRRGVRVSSLSYFSKVPYGRGTLVEIPVRKKSAWGIVLSSKEVSGEKTTLRSASFTLRKLPPQQTTHTLPLSLIETADTLAEYYATQPGAILCGLLPAEIRNGTLPIPDLSDTPIDMHTDAHEILHAPTETRIVSYRHIIRTSFAQKASVIIVVPTVEEGTFLLEQLKKGIPGRAHFIHGGLGKTKMRAYFSQLQHSPRPLLTIATPHYAFITRGDVGTVILEHARASSYRGHVRPYIDFRHALTLHAHIRHQRLISADTLIRSEDEFLLREGRAVPFEENHPRRLVLSGTLKTIPMKETPDGKTVFSLFSPALLSAIEKTQSLKGRVFLFSARRGLAPVVACIDCGMILRCPDSGSPLSLHRTVRNGIEERWLVSSVSGFRKKTDDLCPHCGSWRLRERGIGIQHVYDELRQHIPDASLFLFDHHTAATHTKATNIRNAFYEKKGGILLGTALALPYLHRPVDISAVISMDALRAIPSWRQQEESLAILLALREKTLGYVFIQTRTDTDDVIPYAQTAETRRYYTDELTARSDFKYPPYYTFIHLTWKRDMPDTLTTEITTRLAHFPLSLYDTPVADGLAYGLIRVPHANWPEPSLVSALRTLPPSVRIIVNPDRII